MRLALRVEVDPEAIVPRPITDVAAIDFSYARDLGCTIRQVAARRLLWASSPPQLAPCSSIGSPLAWSRDTENMVILSGHYGGDVVFSGHGAGGHPTAVAVVSDLMALAHGSRRVELPSAKASIAAEFEVPHCIRFLVNDRPGIVAEITGALARERINIRAIMQKAGSPAFAAVCFYRSTMQILGAQTRPRKHSVTVLPAGTAARSANAGMKQREKRTGKQTSYRLRASKLRASS